MQATPYAWPASGQVPLAEFNANGEPMRVFIANAQPVDSRRVLFRPVGE